MVELLVVGILCIHLDFLVEVMVLVEGYWWVWIFYSFGFFSGGCGCVKGCWWQRLWLPVSGFAIGGGGAWLMVVDSGFAVGGRFWVCCWWWWSQVWMQLGLGVSVTLHFMGFLIGEYERR